jgi:hypothetical protein
MKREENKLEFLILVGRPSSRVLDLQKGGEKVHKRKANLFMLTKDLSVCLFTLTFDLHYLRTRWFLAHVQKILCLLTTTTFPS